MSDKDIRLRYDEAHVLGDYRAWTERPTEHPGEIGSPLANGWAGPPSHDSTPVWLEVRGRLSFEPHAAPRNRTRPTTTQQPCPEPTLSEPDTLQQT